MKKLSLPLLVLLAACSSSDGPSVTLTALTDVSSPFVPGDHVALHADVHGLAFPAYSWSAGGETVAGALSANVDVKITDAVTEQTSFAIVVTVKGVNDDNVSATVSDEITITVQPGAKANQAPVAVADAYTTGQNVTLNASLSVLANDTDDGFGGSTLTAVLTTQVTHGSLTLNSDGTFSYIPLTGYTGPDAFTYNATDGSLSSAATVTLTVTATNQPPVAVADVYTVNRDSTLTVASGESVLANDLDDHFTGFTLTAKIGTDVTHGTLTLNADGTFTYTPDAAYAGDDSFTYYDDDGQYQSDEVTVTIAVDGNRAPFVLADTNTVKEDATPNTVSGNVLSNDSDPDGDTLFVANAGTKTLAYGSLEIHADGTYTYTLDNSNQVVNALNDGQHLVDTFMYSASDANLFASSTVTITINGTTDNRAPVVVADTNTVKEDATPNNVSGNVLSNDADPDGNILSVTNAGTVTLTYGSLVIHADGTYTYTLDNSNPAVNALNNGQHLTDTFTYVASDGHGGTTASSLTVTINGTTDPA